MAHLVPAFHEDEAVEAKVARDRAALNSAAARLAKTRAGRNALKALLEWLDADGLSLNGQNTKDVFELLGGAWCEYAGSARDAMRDALRRAGQ